MSPNSRCREVSVSEAAPMSHNVKVQRDRLDSYLSPMRSLGILAFFIE